MPVQQVIASSDDGLGGFVPPEQGLLDSAQVALAPGTALVYDTAVQPLVLEYQWY